MPSVQATAGSPSLPCKGTSSLVKREPANLILLQNSATLKEDLKIMTREAAGLSSCSSGLPFSELHLTPSLSGTAIPSLNSCPSSTCPDSESWLSSGTAAALLPHRVESCSFPRISQTAPHPPRPRGAADNPPHSTPLLGPVKTLQRFRPSRCVHLHPSHTCHLLTPILFLISRRL